MAKSLQKNIKYTAKELETYVRTEGSCVLKVNSNLHFSVLPYILADFKHALFTHIVIRKVGYYDIQLDGIVLDVKNIKLLSPLGAIRGDDVRIHVNVNADCYIFRPMAGAVLNGVVKHIGSHHLGVVIYRVFNANIRVTEKLEKDALQLENTIKFRIKKFDLQTIFPYIEGELLSSENQRDNNERLLAEVNDSTCDSGIEEREPQKLNISAVRVKQEPTSEHMTKSPQKKTPVKTIKRTRESSRAKELPVRKVKTEDAEREFEETGEISNTSESEEVLDVKIMENTVVKAELSTDDDCHQSSSTSTSKVKSLNIEKTSFAFVKIQSESATIQRKKRRTK